MAGAIISQIFSFCLATILASEDNGDLDHCDLVVLFTMKMVIMTMKMVIMTNGVFTMSMVMITVKMVMMNNENGDYEKWCFLQMVMMNNEHGFTWRTLGLLLKTHGTAPDVQLKFLQISF